MISPEFLEKLWYEKHYLSDLLVPISWLYALIVRLRRLAYMAGILPVQRVPVPVIVVGNITVGGTGKTPLIIWLVQFLRDNGYKPGVISRGYGGELKKWPQQVRPDSNPATVGDEPVLIAQKSGCPVAVSPKRYIAAKEIIEHTDCDVLLCDDGLQHYGLHRDIEIAVVDGIRRLGNGRCLPAGPLREPKGRLNSVDMVVGNGSAGKNQYLMEYIPLKCRSLHDEDKQCDLESFQGHTVHVIAGIGNPDSFYSLLRKNHINLIKHTFPDHHLYKPEDLLFDDGLPVVMTEKDAVKCREFSNDNFWYVPIEAKIIHAFDHRLTILLQEIADG